jgi:hypothetical protein
MNTDSKILQNTKKRVPPAAGKGRPKGSANKTTAVLKDAILLAAKAADPSAEDPSQRSLEGYLAWAAKETPGPFLGLLGKVLPMQIAGTDADGNPSEILIRVIKPDR